QQRHNHPAGRQLYRAREPRMGASRAAELGKSEKPGGTKMKNTGMIAAFAVVLMTSGCASLTGSEIQIVSLRTKSEQGAGLAKVDCDLRNDKGQWKAVTPGF